MGRAQNSKHNQASATTRSAAAAVADIADDPFKSVMGAARGSGREDREEFYTTIDGVELVRMKTEASGIWYCAAIPYRGFNLFYDTDCEDGGHPWTIHGELTLPDDDGNDDVEKRVRKAADDLGLSTQGDSEQSQMWVYVQTLAGAKHLVDVIITRKLGNVSKLAS